MSSLKPNATSAAGLELHLPSLANVAKRVTMALEDRNGVRIHLHAQYDALKHVNLLVWTKLEQRWVLAKLCKATFNANRVVVANAIGTTELLVDEGTTITDNAIG